VSMFNTGTAVHSKYRPDPLLHLLVQGPRQGTWVTWCGGGWALVENTPSQRRCRKCTILARQDLVGNKTQDNEVTDLDWFLQREVTA
jgi:hypothetical protein